MRSSVSYWRWTKLAQLSSVFDRAIVWTERPVQWCTKASFMVHAHHNKCIFNTSSDEKLTKTHSIYDFSLCTYNNNNTDENNNKYEMNAQTPNRNKDPKAGPCSCSRSQ